MGWGAILEMTGDKGLRESVSTSGRWGEADQASEQAHRESTGTLRAVETFIEKLQGKTVLHLTDCTPVSNAMNSGSRGSMVLQDNAVRLWKLCARWSVHVVSLWIPGDRMVELGVDDLSREGTIDLHDVRVRDEVWKEALRLAKQEGMSLLVDWFADPHNARLPRFWSREPSPGAEGFDALKAISWGRTKCLDCGLEHDSGAWLFPPPPLMSLVVAKLKAERAHGVLLAPFRPDAVWWGVLQQGVLGRCSELSPTDAFSLGDKDESDKNRTYTAVNWRLLCFDFAPDKERKYAVQCQGTGLALPKLSPAELDHKRHLQALMVFEDSL